MKHYITVSITEYLHNLSPYSLHRIIAVSADTWHAILYLITLLQYQLRLFLESLLKI